MSATTGAGADDHTPKVEQYAQRVTVDLDGKDHPGDQFRLVATQTWHNLKRTADEVEVHVSTGQNGLHFIAWFEDDLPFHDQLAIRRENADDPRRVDMDRQRWLQLGGRFSDVLFCQKGDRETTKERRFRDVYDALDYIDGRRDDSARIERLVEHGHRGAPDLAPKAPGGSR